MKKIISLLLVTLLLVVTFPVFAADTITTAITSVKAGDTFAVGELVPLLVETNESSVARIDFFANGFKIPGTSTDVTKAVPWKPEAAGTYTLTAKVFSTADLVVGTESAPITVTVEDPDSMFVVQYGSAVTNTSNEWNKTEAERPGATAYANSTYTKFSQVSATMSNEARNGGRYFMIYDINKDITGYGNVNMSIYAEVPMSVMYTLTTSNGNATGEIGLQAGWNIISLYTGANTIKSFSMHTAYDTVISSGYPNAGISYNKQNGKIHFDAMWVTKEALTAPAVKETSIPDGQENVCNELKKYTITFDQAMNEDTLVKENVVVEDEDGNEVTVTDVVTAPDKMQLIFADNSFAYEGTYTVSLKKEIEGASGKSIGENNAFDFTIVTSCVNADPILSMTYPKNGATVASNNAILEAKVIFDGNVNKVEFYNSADDSLIGEATEGANGEYYLVKDDFATGAYSVYAKVTYNESASTLDTKLAPVDFTVAETVSYEISGITNNEKVAVNPGPERVYSRTVGLNTTNYVSKVVYKDGGVEKATVSLEPFSWEMPIEDTNSHAISAVVYDTMGGINEVAAVNYQAVYTVTSYMNGSEFTSGTAGAEVPLDGTELFTFTNNNGTMKYAADPSGAANNTVATFTPVTSGVDTSFGFNIKPMPASKIVQIDFDIYMNNPSNVFMRIDKHSVYAESSSCIKPFELNYYTDSAFKPGKDWNHITVLFDKNTFTSKTYVNGVFYKIFNLKKESYNPPNQIGVILACRSTISIDNISVSAVNEVTATEPLVDKVTFTDNTTDWNADFVVANLTNAAKECTVFYAVYDANDNLIAVNSNGEKIDLAAGAIAKKSYKNIAKTYGDKTGTKIRGFVWESVSGVTTLRPLGNIK